MSTADDRVQVLAQARGETPEQVRARFSPQALARCPRRFTPMVRYLPRIRIAESGVRDGLAFVRLENGRTLYGHVSRPSHARQYEFLKDLVSPALTGEAFLLALNVATRYARDPAARPFAFPVPPGATVLEVGAFVGHLTLWFAESVGARGKVVAVEMMPDNVRILRRNVAENGLQGIVEVVECGAWNAPGTLAASSKGMQRNSLTGEGVLADAQTVEVRVDTLDNILERLQLGAVDVAFITVNGAEVAALEGFRRGLERTRAVAVSAPYDTVAGGNARACAALLAAAGFEPVPSANPNLVLARKPSG